MRRGLAGLVLLTACATGNVPHVPGDAPPAVDDAAAESKYQVILEQYTGHEGVYDNLNTKAFFYATWQSPQFVAAKVERQAMFKALPAAERAELLANETKRLVDGTELFMAVHVNDSHFDDFDRSSSMWRLALVVHGEELRPLSVERLGRTNIELRSTYSYMESFWVGYRVRFAKVTLQPGEKLTFRAASAIGKVDLTFTAE